jgi:hypothetical protein
MTSEYPEARAVARDEFVSRHEGHAVIWDADGLYCMTDWESAPQPAAEPAGPEPRPYDLGLAASPDLTWEGIGIAVPSPCELGITSDPEVGWDNIEPQPEPEPEAEIG